MKALAALTILGLTTVASAGQPLDLRWSPGAEQCETNRQPVTESRALDVSTILIRQDPCVEFEAPILYLLLGERRALLVDSGASEELAHTAALVKLVDGLRVRPDGTRLPLMVVHTHRHSDHRAGDAAFAASLEVEVAPIEGDAMRKFLKLANWPQGVSTIDLGDRIVDVIPAPGHHEDHLVFYDRRTQLLLTGDFLLPGRLLVDDLDAYEHSARRIADFVATHPVSHVLGAHIELDANGELYPHGGTLHANERDLALSADDVKGLPAALAAFNGFYSAHPNYVVENPIHNLAALAAGVLLFVVLAVWIVRRLWKRRRTSRTSSS